MEWSAGRVAPVSPTPKRWPIRYNFTFLDATTMLPVPAVTVGTDLVTGDISHTGPESLTTADARGRWSHTEDVHVSLCRVPGTDQLEGMPAFSDKGFLARSPGYRERTVVPWTLFRAAHWVKVAPNETIVRSSTVLLHPLAAPAPATNPPSGVAP